MRWDGLVGEAAQTTSTLIALNRNYPCSAEFMMDVIPIDLRILRGCFEADGASNPTPSKRENDASRSLDCTKTNPCTAKY